MCPNSAHVIVDVDQKLIIEHEAVADAVDVNQHHRRRQQKIGQHAWRLGERGHGFNAVRMAAIRLASLATPLAGDVFGRAVADGGAQERKANRNIYGLITRQQFEGNKPLIVIGRDDSVITALLCIEAAKKSVRREGALRAAMRRPHSPPG